jgi:hypothetical protein
MGPKRPSIAGKGTRLEDQKESFQMAVVDEEEIYIPNFKFQESIVVHTTLSSLSSLSRTTYECNPPVCRTSSLVATNGNNNNNNSKNNNNHPRTIRCIFLGHMRKSRTDRRCYFTHVAHMDIVTRMAVAIMRMVRIIMAMAVWDLQQAKQGKGMGNVLRIVIFPMDFVPVHLHMYNLRKSQVNNLAVTFRINQHIFQFQIAIGDAAVMEMAQRLCNTACIFFVSNKLARRLVLGDINGTRRLVAFGAQIVQLLIVLSFKSIGRIGKFATRIPYNEL